MSNIAFYYEEKKPDLLKYKDYIGGYKVSSYKEQRRVDNDLAMIFNEISNEKKNVPLTDCFALSIHLNPEVEIDNELVRRGKEIIAQNTPVQVVDDDFPDIENFRRYDG